MFLRYYNLCINYSEFKVWDLPSHAENFGFL